MRLNVTSWNTQGDGLGKIEMAHRYLYANGFLNAILIQEAGVLDDSSYNVRFTCTIHRKDYYGYFVPALNAQNERCTTGMLVEQSIFTAPPQFGTFDSGERRPVVYVPIVGTVMSFNLATVHAVAQHSVAKREVLRIFNTLDRTGQNWLMMGDFNCTPQELLAAGLPANRILYSGRATQQSGNELDYTVFSNAFVNQVRLTRGCPGDPDFVPSTSDHVPVYTQFVV